MKRVEGQHICRNCNCSFDWHFVDLNVGEVFIGRMEDRLKNVRNWQQLNVKNHYSVQVKCPNCRNDRDFVNAECTEQV